MKLDDALEGMLDAREQLLKREALHNPTIISEQTYRLGQYTAEVERFLGEAEKEYEIKWAREYNLAIVKLAATAAKQKADVECAENKGNIKELTRLVGSSWKIHTGNMARWNHLQAEMKGTT